MKLSELKPCGCCEGPLLGAAHIGQWYVVRVSQAMLSPRAANEVLGMTQFFQGALGLAEVFAPGADKAVMILGDEDKELLTELHLCFNCVYGRRSLGDILEIVRERAKAATT